MGVPEVVTQMHATIRAVKSAAREAERVAGPGRLTPSTAFLLGRLVATGGARCGELAEDIGVDASVVSRQLAELSRHGLSERRPDPADGRAWLAVATEDGRSELDRFYAEHLTVLNEALADWSAADSDRLTALLARLERDVSRAAHEHHFASERKVSV